MSRAMNFLYLFIIFITINSFLFAISYLIPGIKERDVLPYQMFSFVLMMFYKIIPEKKSIV